MEKYLMEKFKEILEKEEEITNVELFYNIEGSWVISYYYNGEKYLIDNVLLDMVNKNE